ncbi:ABC transporter ATP-binding protein [uncultured Nitrosomonas sp.]|uniref:ABC transporter ATP-binding protein n=1 Tax=uncultured Nitrosomonas sp. TaxID=156424 RepID=UPI00262FDC78|nr:ABC transporter ATP-binding protein [uncultured Nitrosomonas sp.]
MTPSHTTTPLIRLLRYGSAFRGRIWLATLYSVLNKLFDLAPPVLIGMAVDIVVNQQTSVFSRFGFPEVSTQLWILATLTLIVWGFESIWEYLLKLCWRNLAQDIQHSLRLDAYSHVQKLDLAYFEARSTGGMLAVLNDDVNQLERFLDVGANDLIQLLTTVITVGGMFIYLTPGVAWMALLPMPFVVAGSYLFQKRIAPRYTAMREQVGILNSYLANNLGGIATIKSYTAEQYELRQIERESQIYQEKNQHAIALSAAFVPIIRMVIALGFSAIMIAAGLMAAGGELNVGAYSILVFMTQRLLWPLTRLGETLDLYQRAMASTHRVLDLLQTEPTIVNGPQTLPTARVSGEIVFDDVSFNYEQRTATLNHLSLTVHAGQTIALVGATGSGKSTIVKLLLRFYEPQQGHILLDSHDIRDLHLYDLRQSIGLVSQDVYLFHGTVYENIAYGSFGASMEDVITAARTAEAHDFIMELPDGYQTIVGERGQKLSGGQRQRISIARAILKNPPVLVLDEATSAVDNETEAAIQRSLERITVGRTTIVIAHRLSTIRNAHCIYVLDKGEVVETGTHEALLARNGLYANLWQVQTGEKMRTHG